MVQKRKPQVERLIGISVTKSEAALLPASFVAGFLSPIIGIAIGATVEAFIGLLITMGVIGILGIVIIIAIQVIDEVKTIMMVILSMDWLYVIGLLCGIGLLLITSA